MVVSNARSSADQGSMQVQDAMPSTVVVPDATADKVLCPHCLRTATNGLKCKGICVADSDY
ncbi:hypothetical protein [Prochlorothrix hollandica]|uniref:Uncharacterized protein n=1 Tax=Prochlorothrix hollandica PCC 9006 = CALU 1027 TaxID=317619 RepID=A0A0M2PU70_PROHO|nr:hypothetical protein [Prochlorothrix hollandica]KKI98203.1 hypothetical protein PROH_21245 [Prochlorothrix hollandica PCC 9006 = CALU 1027]